jgi:5-methylcytosine-specific restriction protein A
MPSGRWQGSYRRKRLPPGWETVMRPVVFATYGDTCHLCGQPGADTIDHVTPGDDHSLANLRPAHDDPCHRLKSAHEGVAARARRRALVRRPTEPHPGLLR